MTDLNELLLKLVERGGSDLHVTVGMPPVMRINGRLLPTEGTRLTTRDTKELLYSILTDEQRETLERNWEFDFGYALPGVARFRVNVYYQRNSIGAAFRHIPVEIKTFEELRLPTVLESFCRKPRGFVLVTGPTGSGKSTTLATMVDYINTNEEVHIMTVEDPIEYLHHHKKAMINQREVGSDTKSFSQALKYILRQDPDVIMIGEMRDLETVQAALTAAETGHLVLATLHTQDAAQTIDRVVDVFPPYQQQQIRVQLAGTLQGILSQQLIPTIDGRGRVVASEVLVPTSGIRNMIREGKTHQLPSALQAGHQYGMFTMDQSLAELYRQGLVSLDGALQRAVDPNILKTLLGRSQ
ncbi:MAG: type IV pilus twitching motility protein PilT [Coriobacteriia bacterium]|nr:type IV pilus twitching motility protein PilT [Coriobacteriia bacterium]MBN2822648.1 type IV pilus twitching motility protein PilT [Coriobacteriia bacterium]